MQYFEATRHDPDAGQWGDCFRCCMASVMGLDRHEVPHFMDQGVEPSDAYAHYREWLAERGYALGWVTYEIDSIAELVSLSETSMPAVPLIAGGTTSTGVMHVNVIYRGQIHMNAGADIVGPAPEGHFHVYFIAKGAPND